MTTGFPRVSKMSTSFLWWNSSLFRKIVGMWGTLYFSNSAYWWILLAQIFMDSGSSMTFNPSSHAVFDTMYDVYRGSVVARMKTELYSGISEMSSLKRKWNSCPASSAASLKFWSADSSRWSEKLYFSTKQAI